jgi:hypothetical protein
MKFPSILSLPLGLCFALSINFSQAQIVDTSAPSRPAGSRDVDLGLVTAPAGDVFYRNAQVAAPEATGTISDPFAPFGSVPATDKTGEDGSVAIRDLNGLIIWIDNQNKAVAIPNSSLAVTLYVSNSECVVWENRFDETYNTFDSETRIVIHRRNELDAVVSTPVTPIIGTAVGTAPITRSPSGYTVIAVRRNLEFDYLQDFTQYRITFDGQIQKHYTEVFNPDFHDLFTPTGVQILETPLFDNIMGADLLATSADGSSVLINGDDELLWSTWNPGTENITNFGFLLTGNPIYVTNNRLLLTDGGTVQDVTKSGADVTLQVPYPIPGGVTLLQFDKYTDPSAQILIYGIDGLQLSLFTIDGGIVPLGAPLALPAAINTVAPRVRNAIAGSLLIRSEGSPRVLWVKAVVDFATGIITGLDSVEEIPFSSQGGPLFVSNEEAVVWMNASAPLASGEVPAAVIAHFSGGDGLDPLIRTDLSPPIIGRHVASAPLFTPDPKSQGWFVKTFQKTFNDATVIRTYRLQTLENNDSDGDGLYDWQEAALRTDANNSDTDGDGISDGLEVFPFYFIDGNFTFAQATNDAQNRAGNLAVLDTEIIREGFRRTNGNITNGSIYWLGGKGSISLPRKYRWIYPGLVVPANSVIIDPLWAVGYPTTANGANYVALNTNYNWITQRDDSTNGYILQFRGSNPRKPDTDLDGITDSNEYFNGTNPTVPNSFSGVPVLPPPPVINVPFNSASIATKYYGLVYDPEQGHVGSMTMQVGVGRGFTYNYQGLLGRIKASGRGKFSRNGKYSGVGPTGLSDVVSVKMQYVRQSPGVWIILGVMQRASGETLGFELRRAKYNGTNKKYPTPTNYTMAIPLADSVLSEPRGDAAVTGSITKNGLASFNVYLPNNARTTYSAPILDGELLAMNALTTSLNKPTLIGPVNMGSTRPTLHYDGTLRLFAQATLSGGQFISGLDQQRVILGSRYSAPSRGFFPIGGITATSFNTRYNMVGGDFGGITKIGTWDLSHRISIPRTPIDTTTATYTTSNGLLTFSHTRTDASKNLFNATAKGYAVALQKPKQIRGYYHHAVSTGQITVTKHNGTIPPITTISPLTKAVPVTGEVYYVQVVNSGAWEVLPPSGPTITVISTVVTPADPVTGTPETSEEVETQVPWVSAEIVSGGTGLIGNGNGVVKITVQENTTGLWFYSTVEIAGINHKITQDFTVRR